ncbi:Translocating chain-associated membrane protein 1 [Fasciola gigantica]|uniref:Translocating chain-associated membrane protein 1 n=1 Tax=Fasciola gigantica TaxID=46835 RepID=A0A504YR01_FASGI|nr:Translocating chain-associated membrane protein 1 [Fasciola gigantica]
MTVRPVRKKSKNPSYFSHEFIISNHGDIVSFFAMIIVMGLLYKGTHSFSSAFLFIQHNVTDEDHPERPPLYSPGKSDLCVIFFYTLIFIVAHAVLQEYVFDRFSRKLNLTKARVCKFNESAHLACFYPLSVFWAVYNILNENLIPSLNSLWEGYPHSLLPFWTKLFLIAQICFWLHDYPELYFQKVKKELIPSRVLTASLYLIGVSLAYIGGLSKLCMALIVLHYATDIFFHIARAFHFADYSGLASVGFTIWNVVFIPVRMTCTILAFLALHYGLGKQSVPVVDLSTGNFNTATIRMASMAFLFISQVFMVWNFITFHQRRRRDRSSHGASKSWFSFGQDSSTPKKKEKKKVAKREDEEPSEGDSDQNNQKEIRRRKPIKTRPQ